MKTKQIPKINISVSREHKKYKKDIRDSFVGLDVNFTGNLERKSLEDLPMQVMIFLGGAFVGGAAWDILKLGIKKLFNKFSNIRIVIRDDESIMYGIKSDFSVNVVVVPDRIKEFEKIKSFDDLIVYLSSKDQGGVSDNWQLQRLGNLAAITRGGSPRPIEEYITDDKDGLNWLRIGDIDVGAKFIIKTSQKIKKEGLSKTTLVHEGDFILSNSMSYGRPYIMKINACIHDGWLALKDIKTSLISKEFLYYLLSSRKIQNIFISISAGSGVQNLKKETVSNVSVKLPLISEQNRIVAVLEAWDGAIERLANKIEVKKNIKKGLMQRLLTGKLRLPGFSDTWQTVKLGDVCEIKKGQDLSKEKLTPDGRNKCILYGELYTKYDDIILEVISKTDINEGVKSNAGDVLIPASTTTNALDLAIAICLNEKDVLLGGDINILRQKKKYNSNFLALYLTHVKKHSLARLAQGITIIHLYGKDCKKIKLELPSLEEQQAIADIIINATKELYILERKLIYLKDQKKYLLNNLITGTIRTPETLTINV